MNLKTFVIGVIVAVSLILTTSVYTFSYPTNKGELVQNKSEYVIHEGMFTYYENADGTWSCQGKTYKYCLSFLGITGANPINVKYIVLTNSSKDLNFAKVNYSTYSNNSSDFLENQDSLLVDILID